jgi:hypothetical protein
MFHSVFKKFSKSLDRRGSKGIQPRFAPRVETLEQRTVPATLTVGAGKEYPTITAALDNAAKNDTIKVYPGVYDEAVKIGINGIKLVAASSSAVIQPTTVSQVTLAGPNVLSSSVIGGAAVDIYATGVSVTGFTVDGSKDTDGNLWAGIRVIKGGSATISNDTFTGMTQGSAQNDVAIQIGTSVVSNSSGEGTATVSGNSISDYAGAGIVVDGVGATATLSNNTIVGRGKGNGGLSEYGIQVSNGANAQVKNNNVSENTVSGKVAGGYNPAPASAGIFFYEDGGTSSLASGNSVSENDDGILVQLSNGTPSVHLSILHNTAAYNYGYSGIVAISSNYIDIGYNTVQDNTTFNGIALNETSFATVTHNTIVANANADGVYDYQGSNNAISYNDASNNGDNGVNIDHSSGDIIVKNMLDSNGQYGVSLESGVNTQINYNAIDKNTLGKIYMDASTTGTTEKGNT